MLIFMFNSALICAKSLESAPNASWLLTGVASTAFTIPRRSEWIASCMISRSSRLSSGCFFLMMIVIIVVLRLLLTLINNWIENQLIENFFLIWFIYFFFKLKNKKWKKNYVKSILNSTDFLFKFLIVKYINYVL